MLLTYAVRDDREEENSRLVNVLSHVNGKVVNYIAPGMSNRKEQQIGNNIKALFSGVSHTNFEGLLIRNGSFHTYTEGMARICCHTADSNASSLKKSTIQVIKKRLLISTQGGN